MRRIVSQILIAAAIVLGVSMLSASCGGGSDQAKLRVINASPDAGSMDVLVDTKTISSGLVFGTATGYTSLSSGSRHIQIEPSGTGTPVVDETLNLGSGSDITVLLANFAATLNAVTLLDNNSAPSSGTGNVRIVNAAPSLGLRMCILPRTVPTSTLWLRFYRDSRSRAQRDIHP